jgi:hypothetical protein
LGGFGPGGVVEGEAVFEEDAGGDAAAFEDEFGFGAEEEGANREHPAGGGEAEALAPGSAEIAHKGEVGDGVRGGEVNGTADGGGDEEEVDGAGVVLIVHPGDILVAAALGAAEVAANEFREDLEDAAAVGAHDKGGAESDAAGAGGGGVEEGLLPLAADVDAKSPGAGDEGLLAALLAGELVLIAVQGVAVDGGGAGVEPDGRGCGGLGDGAADEAGGEDAGVEDLAAVAGGVAGVDGASGEMDDGVGAVELGGPRAEVEAVPGEGLPGGLGEVRFAREDGYDVAGRGEMTGEDLADLTGAAGDEDAHAVWDAWGGGAGCAREE